MASGKEYLHFILEQLSNLDDISYRPMMGEFILYYRGKIVGGIYDDRLLVKKTRSALELMPAAICELPYEGAKEMLLVDEVDSKVFLTELFEAMVNGYGYHLPDRIIKPAKMVQTPTAGVLFLWVCRDSREAAQGVQPLVAAKPPMSVRGGSKLLSLCADKPSAERTRPQGCISAPLVPKGFIRRSRFRLVFSDIPVLVHSSVQAGEARQLPRRSWSLLPAQCFQRLRPGR